jgi:hypothetical protein
MNYPTTTPSGTRPQQESGLVRLNENAGGAESAQECKYNAGFRCAPSGEVVLRL